MKEQAKEIIPLEFLIEIDKLRQEAGDHKWDNILSKIDEFKKTDNAKLATEDIKTSILHAAYGEALFRLSKKDEALKEMKFGLEIHSLVNIYNSIYM